MPIDIENHDFLKGIDSSNGIPGKDRVPLKSTGHNFVSDETESYQRTILTHDILRKIIELEGRTASIAQATRNIADKIGKIEKDYETRLRTLETTTQSNTIVISAVKWVTLSVLGTGLTVIALTILDKIGQTLGN